MGFKIQDNVFYHNDWPAPDPAKTDAENMAVRWAIMHSAMQKSASYWEGVRPEPLPCQLEASRHYEETDDYKRMHHPDPAVRLECGIKFHAEVSKLMSARNGK